MKLFILAAGKGERLGPLTKNTPKSLMDFGDGTTILERQIDGAVQSGMFSEIVIITGYKAEQIEAKIKDYKPKVRLKTLYNPFFEITNNLVSLWVAAGEMTDEDFVITNGDNIYFGDVFRTIANDAENVIQITVDHKPQYDDDDMKVSRDTAGAITRVHKGIENREASAESVGLALVKGTRCRRLFVNKVLQLVRNKEYLNKFWLEIFNSLIEDGVVIASATIKPDDWQEVDFHPDVEVMKSIIIKRHHE